MTYRLHRSILARNSARNGFGPWVFNAPLKSSLTLSRGTGSATFARNSVATVMGYAAAANLADGQTLLTVAANEARFQGARRVSEGVWSETFADGTPIPDATLKGYLAEGSRTNLCLQSNAFTTTWTETAAVNATQNALGIDGATSGWTLTDASAVGLNGLSQDIAVSAGQTYAYSIFIKKKASGPVYPAIILFYNLAALAGSGLIVDEVAGTISALSGGVYTAPVASRIESFNADYWRVQVAATQAGATVSVTAQFYPAASTDGTTLDNGATGATVFTCAQVELGSFASSPIPTTTAAVTRTDDSNYFATAGNFSDTAGTIYFEAEATSWANASGRIVGDAAEGILASASNSGVQAYDGTNTVNGTAGSPSGQIKVAVAWSGSTMSVCVNGGTVATGSYDGAWNLSALFIGNGFFGNVRNVRSAIVRLSDNQLKLLTA